MSENLTSIFNQKPLYGDKVISEELLHFWIRMEKLFDCKLTINEVAVLVKKMNKVEKEFDIEDTTKEI